MLRMVYNVSWCQHLTNKILYGNLPTISSIVKQRRLSLAGHVSRHDEPAARLLLWSPQEKRRVGSPNLTLKALLLEDTNLSVEELSAVMKDKDCWRNNFVKTSPMQIGGLK